ncbi:calmodulin binding protein PICBP-like [Solanum verrucosum]|uniref:calmodulin binding protein PICBP-like n=1 Tax=Solanum verrucosum TaxID=315347 RepID=UPI0020D10B4C|nr:calmodulin binding protein PICBP-like [Solanum verrucosum]
MITNFGNRKSSWRRSKSRIKQLSPSDYATTPQHPSSLEVSELSTHCMKVTSSCSEGKQSHIQASPHSPSSRKSSSTLSSSSKSTCSSILKDSKFPQQVELHPGLNESDRVSKVKVCSYHHCSLNKRSDDPSPPIKRVYRRRKLLKSHKSIRLESESTNADNFSIEDSNLIQDVGVFGVNEAIDQYADLVEIVFGETSFPERSYQETIDIMRKYSTQLVTSDVESNDQSVTTSVFCNNEDRDADFCHTVALPLLIKPVDNDVTTGEEDEDINRELSKNEPSLTYDLVEAKCSTEFSSASASNDTMKLVDNLQETDDKANPTEDVDPNASAKKLNIAQFSKEKHRSMWSLIHRHMLLDESTELDSKVIRGAEEDNYKDSGKKSCAAESSDSFLSFSERESMTTNQDANNQEIETRKLLAVKLVREAIKRILLPEVQDQSSDNQSVTSEVCTEENSNKSDTKNEECDKASKSDEGNVTRDNTGCPEKQENEELVTNKAEKKVPTHWSNLKRWIILQRFIKELEKLRKFNPRKPRYLQLEPDPEAEKVNLKHQIEDERKSAEEWMLDYALQKAISQLALTQKRKVGLLVTAFENVVPPRGSNIQVTFPTLKTRNEDNLQTAGKGNASVSNADNVRKHVDKRNAEDDRSMLKNDDTQKAIVLCKKLDEVTSTLSDKGSVEIEKFDDSLSGTSSTISNLGNDGDKTHENNMNLSECEATVSKQKHISMWHLISQHILSDVVSKIGNEQLNEVNNNKTLAETNRDNSLHDFSEEKDDMSHNGRSFSRNDAVNLIREAVSQILTTPTQDDSSNTQSVTSNIVQDEQPPKTDHTDCGEQNSTKSLYESLKHGDSQLETKELAGNNTITESKFEPPKSKNWSKLKKMILLKRSIKVLERARKVNPQPPQLLPPTPDQEQEKVDLRNQMSNERNKAEQWMLDNAVQHMVSKLTPARKTRVAMLVEAFEAVVPLPEV